MTHQKLVACKHCRKVARGFKTKTNYPHGKKSKGLTIAKCKFCGGVQ